MIAEEDLNSVYIATVPRYGYIHLYEVRVELCSCFLP